MWYKDLGHAKQVGGIKLKSLCPAKGIVRKLKRKLGWRRPSGSSHSSLAANLYLVILNAPKLLSSRVLLDGFLCCKICSSRSDPGLRPLFSSPLCTEEIGHAPRSLQTHLSQFSMVGLDLVSDSSPHFLLLAPACQIYWLSPPHDHCPQSCSLARLEREVSS